MQCGHKYIWLGIIRANMNNVNDPFTRTLNLKFSDEKRKSLIVASYLAITNSCTFLHMESHAARPLYCLHFLIIKHHGLAK